MSVTPLALLLLAAVYQGQQTGPDVPVPDGQEMKRRVMSAMKTSEKDLENFSCMVRDEGQELNSDGSIKKQESSLKEQFFVKGVEIDHTLEKNGRPLSPAEAKKEQQKVDKEVRKYSDPKQAEKSRAHDEKEVDVFLRAVRLSSGRRTSNFKRSILMYDLSGDPAFHPRNLEERFAESLNGRIWIDEESGMVAELRFETIKDVKLGGGLVANLHKGFWLHLIQERQPDGVWITKSVDGSGDARAALFVHARFRFKEQLDKCHLFSVSTHQTLHDPNNSDVGPSQP